jgi:hypothetical protein
MKILLILVVSYAVAGLVEAEPDLITEYAQTPKARCIQAYQGTANISQCEYL